MQTAAGIFVFLLIIAAAAWLFKPSKPAPPLPEIDVDFPPTDAGAVEGGTPAMPPAGGDPTTQDTGGGPPVKPK